MTESGQRLQGKVGQQVKGCKEVKGMRMEKSPQDSLTTCLTNSVRNETICQEDKREQEIDYERRKKNDKLRNKHVQVSIFHG